MSKDIMYGEDARKALLAGIDKLADTVKLPLDQKDATLFWIKIRCAAYHQRRCYHCKGN